MSPRRSSFCCLYRRTLKIRPGQCLALIALLTIALGSASQAQEQASATSVSVTPPQFMDLITHWPIPWPTVPFYGLRLMPTDTNWGQINTANGVYDWTTLDMWLQAGKDHGKELVFTLAFTPSWASSKPGDLTCFNNPGSCDPPEDVNVDGTGTDQHWKDFVTAIVQHVGTQITYWEVWNEPRQNVFWTGTATQLARMARDARSIILSANPNAKLLNGGTSAFTAWEMKWWYAYAQAGGLQSADIIAVHGGVEMHPGVCGVYPQPENFPTVVSNLHTLLAQYGQSAKPIWDTETSWGPTNQDCFTNQDLQAAFLARFYLLHLSEGIKRLYWRAWIDSAGGIATDSGQVTKAGVAYQQLYGWIVGKTLTQACSANGSIWTCDFTGPSGYVAEAIWDTSLTCNSGGCDTIQYAVGSEYTQYRTLAGSTVKIKSDSVPIGAKPILVEN